MPTINTLRGLLVAGAGLAAVIAAALGQWLAATILLVGIAFHAALWVQLYRNREPTTDVTGPEMQPPDRLGG